MIKGELIVDNFAGGIGTSQSSGTVCCRAYTEYEYKNRTDRAAPVCLSIFKFLKQVNNPSYHTPPLDILYAEVGRICGTGDTF